MRTMIRRMQLEYDAPSSERMRGLSGFGSSPTPGKAARPGSVLSKVISCDHRPQVFVKLTVIGLTELTKNITLANHIL